MFKRSSRAKMLSLVAALGAVSTNVRTRIHKRFNKVCK